MNPYAFCENSKRKPFCQKLRASRTVLFALLCGVAIEENRYRFEKSPNMPWPANQNIGLERPIRLEAGKKYHIQMILDDTIATIYVDGVALNTRFYQKFGQSLSLFVTDGTLTVTNAGLSKTIK